MKRTVFAIRPEPGFSATVQAGCELGLEMAGEPLFEVRPVDWDLPKDMDFDGLLIGSANAIRHGGRQLLELLSYPVHAVGKTTADIAAEAGFSVASTGRGGLQRVVDDLEGQSLRLLRLCGEERTALTLSAGISIEERVVYRSAAIPMSAGLAGQLQEGGIVLLHSARAAEHFAAQTTEHDIDRRRIALAALAPRIAESCGMGWQTVSIAPTADDGALLAKALYMCKND